MDIIGVYVSGKKVDIDRARRIASRFGTDVLDTEPADKDRAYFHMDKTGLSFCCGGQELKGDFNNVLSRVTNGHLQHEIILKAAKLQPQEGVSLKAFDATAGMGEDSFILAAGGYSVEMCEHNPIMAELLNDALIRARKNPQLSGIASRMSLRQGDSKEILSSLTYRPDLIYLDPMFAEKKKSAESKKKMQVFHQIEMPCSDEKELMQAALDAKPKKILIKRPPEGEYLAGITPTYSVERKAVRYDCIALGDTE